VHVERDEAELEVRADVGDGLDGLDRRGLGGQRRVSARGAQRGEDRGGSRRGGGGRARVLRVMLRGVEERVEPLEQLAGCGFVVLVMPGVLVRRRVCVQGESACGRRSGSAGVREEGADARSRDDEERAGVVGLLSSCERRDACCCTGAPSPASTGSTSMGGGSWSPAAAAARRSAMGTS